DLTYAGLRCRSRERTRGRRVSALEVGLVKGVDQVDRDIDTGQRVRERRRVIQVAAHHALVATAAAIRGPGPPPHRKTLLHKAGNQAPSAEASRTRHEDGRRHGHTPSLPDNASAC